ncbi:HEAT repeat-containing PBS lyase [Myxococcus stipitatus DSM 14675]|uniref:HEAT repeat-containing PBS lyase n=1 Tax=Myxococcus stipitatus (strain DSM 14675 / JCM 12634 / Mx s8) TaxID=1278073 RepID=L7UDJ2_MYXSD|nr:HEAT repeat domain-containing protein [Myxococcus stipitatus]AGC44519.1 HEAT repeat-containing PBS lyase [Myxococcus stipitatus DSM 14675]
MSESKPVSQEQRESSLRDILGSDRTAMVQAATLLSSDASTTSQLVELLQSERRIETRHAILYALSWHSDLKLWDLMVQMLSDSNEAPLVRGQAAEGLAYMFSKVRTVSREFEVAVNALAAALKDPSPEVRYCAVHALGTTGHPPVKTMLEEMLVDQNRAEGWVGTVGEAASRAIETLELAHGMRIKGEL